MQSCLQISLRAKRKRPRKKIPKLCRGMPMLIGISKACQSQVQTTQMTVGEWGQLSALSWVLGALCSATNSESWVQLALEEDLNPPPERGIPPIWESPDHIYSHYPALSTWRKACQGVSTVPGSELIMRLASLSGCPREDKGKVAHLALSSRFLRTFPHATSFLLDLGV